MSVNFNIALLLCITIALFGITKASETLMVLNEDKTHWIFYKKHHYNHTYFESLFPRAIWTQIGCWKHPHFRRYVFKYKRRVSTDTQERFGWIKAWPQSSDQGRFWGVNTTNSNYGYYLKTEQMEAMQSARDLQQQEISRLNDSRGNAFQQINNLKAELRAGCLKAKQDKEQIETLERDLAQSQKQMVDSQQQAEHQRDIISEQKNQEMEAHRQSVENLTQQMTTLQAEKESIRSDYRHSESKRERLRQRVDVMEEQRAENERDLIECRKQLSEEQHRNKMKEESIPWTVIWCSITAVVTIMMAVFVFCLCHRHRARKNKKEIRRLERVMSVSNENQRQRKDGLIEVANAENVQIPMEEDQCDPSLVPVEEDVVGNTLPSKYGESFDVMVENMSGVEDALMDGIMEEMVTDGQESVDGDRDEDEEKRSELEEGYQTPTKR